MISLSQPTTELRIANVGWHGGLALSAGEYLADASAEVDKNYVLGTCAGGDVHDR